MNAHELGYKLNKAGFLFGDEEPEPEPEPQPIRDRPTPLREAAKGWASGGALGSLAGLSIAALLKKDPAAAGQFLNRILRGAQIGSIGGLGFGLYKGLKRETVD